MMAGLLCHHMHAMQGCGALLQAGCSWECLYIKFMVLSREG